METTVKKLKGSSCRNGEKIKAVKEAAEERSRYRPTCINVPTSLRKMRPGGGSSVTDSVSKAPVYAEV